MHFDYIHISYTHDFPHSPCYSYIPHSFAINGMTYILTKLECQAQ